MPPPDNTGGTPVLSVWNKSSCFAGCWFYFGLAMSTLFTRIASWLAGRVVLFVFIFALLLVVFAVSRAPRLIVAHLEGELQRAVVALEEVEALSGQALEQADQWRRQIESTAATVRDLEEKRRQLEGWVAWVRGLWSREAREKELRAVEAELQRMQLREEGLRQDLAGLYAAHGETEEELRRRSIVRDAKLQQLEQARDVRRWMQGFMRGEVGRLAWMALGILLLLTLLPLAWKVVAYHVLAPLAERAAPVVFAEEGGAEPVCGESRPAQRLDLESGQELLAKVRYLQSSTDNNDKRTRWLWDPVFPFTSLGAGLFLLTSFRPREGEGACAVTLSCQLVATEELAVVEVPAGASLVFRPSCLAAVLVQRGQLPALRSRWVFNRLASWIDLRFRHLIISGPVRLVFAGQRGVQAERVTSLSSGRRINSGLTAAFTPALRYSPRRAETFVAYLRGASPLFDDFFRGAGLTINQQVGGGEISGARRLWEGFFNAIGKVFGL
jgi:hypothetical protein